MLFPQVAAIVHHGGAGTTAAAARARVPQVITPMFGDQFYWASRIVELGVGATTPHTTMTEESVAAALNTTWKTLQRAKGTGTVSASLAFRVARVAGVSVDEVITGRYAPDGVCPHCGERLPE